jgi:hypothetical protein
MRFIAGLLIGAVVGGALAFAKQPPPVILELGPVLPTPVPSPKQEDRIRLITSLTITNRPDGNSVISFEATDFGRGKLGKFRTLATELYTLVEPKKKAEPTAERIMAKIRDLEHDLLEFVQIAGPPRERVPLLEQGPASQPR